MKRMVILLTFAFVLLAVFALSSTVSAQETTDDAAEDESDSESIWDWIKGFVSSIFTSIVNVIKAPFEAIATIFMNWANTLQNWYGPIVAVFVLSISWFMIRAVTEFDKWLDLTD